MERTRRWLLRAGAAAGVATHSASAASPLIVFAAASLKPALERLVTRAPSPYVISSSASGLLARQIDSGAPAAIFAAADPKWIDFLSDKGRLIVESRIELARNRLVVIAPRRRARGLASLNDLHGLLRADERWVTADPKSAPLGEYAMAALQSAGLSDRLSQSVAFSQDAPSAVQLVARGGAAFGIVYATDARLSARVSVIATIEATRHKPIIYEAAIVRGALEAARAVLQSWVAPTGRRAFADLGFSPAGDGA